MRFRQALKTVSAHRHQTQGRFTREHFHCEPKENTFYCQKENHCAIAAWSARVGAISTTRQNRNSKPARRKALHAKTWSQVACFDPVASPLRTLVLWYSWQRADRLSRWLLPVHIGHECPFPEKERSHAKIRVPGRRLAFLDSFGLGHRKSARRAG
jgi:hypothetical protein